MTDEGTERDGGDGGDDGDDERVVELLRTADRPRQLASDVAAALGVARGRARTRLQALADEGRVVRTRTGPTARWAVPERADEPDPVDGNGTDPVTDAGEDEPQSGTDVEEETPHSEADAGEDGPTPVAAPGPSEDGDGVWWTGPARLLALAVGVVLALAAVRRLRRR